MNRESIPAAKLADWAEERAKKLICTEKVSGKAAAAALRELLRRAGEKRPSACGEESLHRQWMRDNWYLLRRGGERAAAALEKAEKLTGAGKTPAVCALSRQLVQASSGEVNAQRLSLFWEGASRVRPFTEREVSLIISAVTAALIEFAAEQKEDTEGITTGNAVTSLRFLESFDASGFLEAVSGTEQLLLGERAGIYPRMDAESRRRYRSRVAFLAERQGRTEADVAEAALREAEKRSCHVGEILFPRREQKPLAYFLSMGGICLAMLLAAGIVFRSFWAAALLLLPVLELSKRLADGFLLRHTPPVYLPRLALKEGVPFHGRTLCVVCTMAGSGEDAKELASSLEAYRLLNRDAGPNLFFGILADLPEADTAERAEDKPIIEALQREIARLNRIYGGFSLYLRKRTLSADSGRHMGRERKRGALLGLMRLLRGKQTEVYCAEGDIPGDVRYVITLDGDTCLTAGSAVKLIGAAMHPMNAAKAEKGRVTRGYGVLQPRTAVSLQAAGKTDFTRIFAGAGGRDPYGGVSSDLYQDVFGAGSFTGKGLLDVDAVLSVLDGAFPRERVLSHDLLEGEYLRCGYMGDTELTDGCPKTVLSWYGRHHRWIRGDWQTLPWLCGRVENESGDRVKNPLSSLGKWKILDNLRRSLTSAAVFFCVMLGFLTGNAPLLWAAGTASAVYVLERLCARRRVRYLSGLFSETARSFLRGGVRFLLLPYDAWVSLHAAATALWRMYVSRRNLLSWVTAAEAEKAKGTQGVWRYYGTMWSCGAAGLLLLILSPVPAGKAVGIFWLLAPLCAWSLAKTPKRRNGLNDRDKLWLREQGAKIWQYFLEHVTEEENDLPPDHVQEQPKGETAHRTSPTNIGLALLAAACAWELGLADRETAVRYTERIIAAAEKLPKRNGHLYNWYDTRTAKPLSPLYVSTVDSGNLCCALIALEGWLREIGEEELAVRAGMLSDAMGFDWLYDRQKDLLYIGWDCEKNAPTQGWYDLISSEARASSYLAVARGDVPLRHWEKLGRTPAMAGPYCGMISWTGTMFEYLMPELLLPGYEGSLLGESREFCLYAQKRRVPANVPWGISESAFYAFDRALGYRYKANGVQLLALKQGMDADLVVAPYASFLALMVSPNEAVRNLRRLEAMGGAGKYSFYDAVDFTPQRCGNAAFRVVRTWMVHHLGMSFCAIVNVLRGDRLKNWFAEDPAMGAYRELLQERPLSDAVPLKQPENQVPETCTLRDAYGWQKECPPQAMEPECTLLSNGAYTVVFCSTGQSLSQIDGLCMTAFDGKLMGEDAGISAWLETTEGRRPVTPVYGTEPGIGARAELSCEAGALMTDSREAEVCFTVRVPEAEPGELREAEIRAKETGLRSEFVWSFRPVLAPWREYAAHPAFSRLMLTAMPLPGGVLIRRRGRGERRDVYLCALSSSPCSTDMEKHRNGDGKTDRRGGIPDACITLRIPVELGADRQMRLCLAVASSENPEEAVASAKRILHGEHFGGHTFTEWEASRLFMDGEDLEKAMHGLGELLFRPGRLTETALPAEGRQGLWSLGVSGDLPVLCGEAHHVEGAARGEALIRRHGLYSACGLENDLVLLTGDGGDYHRPVAAELCRYLRKLGMEWQLNERGGVHLADASSEGAAAIRRMLLPDTDWGEAQNPPERMHGEEKAPLACAWEKDGTFSFTVRGKLPENVWSHALSGEKLSCIAADTGMGHCWYQNAREQQISPWKNDPAGTVGPETLELETSRGRASLFAADDGFLCRVRFGFGWAEWEKEIGDVLSRVTMFVDPEKAARLIRVELSGVNGDAALRWCTELVLGNGDERQMVRTWVKDGIFCADRPDGGFAGGTLRFCSTVPWRGASGVLRDWRSRNGRWRTGIGTDACGGFVFSAASMTLVMGCEDGETLRDLGENWQAVLENARSRWGSLCGRLRADVGDRRMNAYLNGWALYQIAACRMKGRASMYQCGGAFGFRDQLQDACGLILWAPETAKEHILYAASRQFHEGDVLHWWHEDPNGPRGVRTRCSDDLLWLPYVLCRYAEMTGEWSIFHEKAPFLSAPILKDEEDERYAPVQESGSGTLLEHARAAVLQVLKRGRGPHGLLHMGSGDWNDGMNRVGGESTWLTWFAALTMEKLSGAYVRLGMREEGEGLKKAAAQLRAAGEAAWTGDRYLRGYYGDGMPLGAPENGECAMDSVAQSFAVFAGADASRCERALDTALRLLYTPENRLVRLLAPPFDSGRQKPGYIKSYAPGYRENGGQYTHAAIWLALALHRSGKLSRAWSILRDILPGEREHSVYRGEPFVLAADISSAPENAGRCGWTWYTGAAGWYLQAAMELLGIGLSEGRLIVKPSLPPEIHGYRAQLHLGERVYRIRVQKEANSQ
ncbi:MAG: hypothetical protein IJC35_00240 [Oscillospiraceae bacterium]|nr:hypothetical protein [Oscillospiraceae bacterium]